MSSRAGAELPADTCAAAAPGPILLVESDREAGIALAEHLAADGYPVELASTAQHARVLARASAPRLALLGGLDPPRGALRLLGEIRTADPAGAPWAPTLPVVVLGAHASQLELLRAFETGADDFVGPPAGYLELRARIRALLQRCEPRPADAGLLEVAGLRIDARARTVSVDGRPVELRRLEFELLGHLARDPERVFTKAELLDAVWGYRSHTSTRTLESHASRLRRRLAAAGAHHRVLNVWGVGYRLI